ncbi:formylglycine-generating enzyme isoform X2 [Arctopsyche grandis]|uniref:formylglycine-generating enzyme isoform X2 n=1 Tax=Arctopsyche grandis TaxID=121162 RepID=UPI00406D7D7D
MKMARYLKIILLCSTLAFSLCSVSASCDLDNDRDSNKVKSSEGQCGINDFDVPDLDVAFGEMALIPGGHYTVGTDEPIIMADMEGPSRNLYLKTFFIDKHAVSNEDYGKFVADTGYETEAEYYGDSFVFQIFLSRERQYRYEKVRAVEAPWWFKLPGANWQQPEGRGSNIKERMSHPVVHVSWHDAVAYCKWKVNGGRLPTEAEWETACRGGKKNKLYPWGNKLMPKGKHWTNIWQGSFPRENTAADGYIGTSPVDEYPANYYGLHNMVGNVWEWTDDHWIDNTTSARVKKGGSYLCHKKFCFRYRCAARSHNTADSTAGNLGFRCALSAGKF